MGKLLPPCVNEHFRFKVRSYQEKTLKTYIYFFLDFQIVTPADTTLALHGVRPDPPYPYQYNGRFFSPVQHNIGRTDRYGFS